MLTRVDRPYLDREATVIGVDHNWRPTERWNIRTRVFGSQVRQPGQDSDDLGATIWADYEMDGGWRQQWLDRKSTRLNSVTNAQLVCRLLLEKKTKANKTS